VVKTRVIDGGNRHRSLDLPTRRSGRDGASVSNFVVGCAAKLREDCAEARDVPGELALHLALVRVNELVVRVCELPLELSAKEARVFLIELQGDHAGTPLSRKE
jgi:hypothetical protein